MIAVPELYSECIFHAVRSSGKGGQHVNKTATKVELYFSIDDSVILSAEQKAIIKNAIGHMINADGNIRLTSEEARTQKQNKEIVYTKFIALIRKALTPVKRRVPTKKTVAANQKRLTEKSKQAEKKSARRKADPDQ